MKLFSANWKLQAGNSGQYHEAATTYITIIQPSQYFEASAGSDFANIFRGNETAGVQVGKVNDIDGSR